MILTKRACHFSLSVQMTVLLAFCNFPFKGQVTGMITYQRQWHPFHT